MCLAPMRSAIPAEYVFASSRMARREWQAPSRLARGALRQAISLHGEEKRVAVADQSEQQSLRAGLGLRCEFIGSCYLFLVHRCDDVTLTQAGTRRLAAGLHRSVFCSWAIRPLTAMLTTLGVTFFTSGARVGIAALWLPIRGIP